MKIKLIGTLDYDKVDKILENTIPDYNERQKIMTEIKNIEIARRAEIVASAGRLSRFKGNVLEIIGMSEDKTLAQNVNFAKTVIGMGHDSISDHDYCVFAIKDVSPVVEQTIIEERFSSFTIKSRREVDFSKVGFYIPDFHDKEGNVLPNNEEIKKEYKKYMESLFQKYNEFIENGVPMEDARFILPYCYHSNILMGVDAHTLKDMIIKFTKTKYANIQELREFGETLYKIAQEEIPYIIPQIDKAPIKKEDTVEEFINNAIENESYQVLEHSQLLNHTDDVDATILISALMRRYQYNYCQAKKIYETKIKDNKELKNKMMQIIAFDSDKLELTQVNFQFQIPLSYAILTHLTRHRTHDIMVPTFVPNPNLSQYKTPPTIKKICPNKYDDIYMENEIMYNHFKEDYGIREEDLVYFVLSGNKINVMTNMDGKTLQHILKLRECNKAQWETRQMAHDMHKEITKIESAETYENILGATCTAQGICNEGKECCGKVYGLKNNKMSPKQS